jgi:hypothetical protein
MAITPIARGNWTTMADKITDVLLDALRRAIAEPAEQRLFRSGKLSGLFTGRTSVHAEAASQALREGLLEVVRSETRGKVTIDWVRPSPRGVLFVHEHESPLRALEDLHNILRVSREGIPVWLAEMRHDLQALVARVADEAERWSHRLDALSQRVEEALRRADAGKIEKANGSARAVPWALDALMYLDRRQTGGAATPCPLPELFAALRLQHDGISMTGFHDGLRRLADHRALQLFPFHGPSTELPQPEYALLDGATVLYYAGR